MGCRLAAWSDEPPFAGAVLVDRLMLLHAFCSSRSTHPQQLPDFTDLTAEGVSQSNASIVADWLRGALVTTGAYTVVERSAMQKILSEQAFQNTGCTSSECAVKLGKDLNVQKMVVGSFGKILDS